MRKSDSPKDFGLFGNLFDLNGDGKTDTAETALMFMMFNEIQKEDERKNKHPFRKYLISMKSISTKR